MLYLTEIEMITDEDYQREKRREYEMLKMTCEYDNLGIKCRNCPLAGTQKCFHPNKGQYAWRWRH